MHKVEQGNARSVIALARNDDARVRLFCFPFAGGGASVFRKWTPHVSRDVQMMAIQMPGRESRLSEDLHVDMPVAVAAIVDDLLPWLDRPFAFLGHSLGSLMSFCVARELRERGAPMPLHMFLSARRAPHLAGPRRALHGLPRDELLRELRSLEGTPSAVLEHEELLELLLPILRADFQLNERYVHADAAPLPCTATVMGGLSDHAADRAQLAQWAQHFAGPTELDMFPGGHFYVDQMLPVLGARIGQRLLSSVGRGTVVETACAAG